MGDVAASGGYYMSMACDKIVAEPLTITGSIGVVTGKLNLGELYDRVGFNKEYISKGKYAEVQVESRAFTPEEEALFKASAMHAYKSFRDKAALSRGMTVDAMEEVAQGRVWTGQRAVQRGLVDALGGLSRAVAIAKEMADIPAEERVTLIEVSRDKPSPAALLGGGAVLRAVVLALVQAGVEDAIAGAGTSARLGPQVVMPNVEVVGSDEAFSVRSILKSLGKDLTSMM